MKKKKVIFNGELTRLEMSHNIYVDDASKHEEVLYNPEIAMMIGWAMMDIHNNVQ